MNGAYLRFYMHENIKHHAPTMIVNAFFLPRHLLHSDTAAAAALDERSIAHLSAQGHSLSAPRAVLH
jgi:hypothetical protein